MIDFKLSIFRDCKSTILLNMAEGKLTRNLPTPTYLQALSSEQLKELSDIYGEITDRITKSKKGIEFSEEADLEAIHFVELLGIWETNSPKSTGETIKLALDRLFPVRIALQAIYLESLGNREEAKNIIQEHTSPTLEETCSTLFYGVKTAVDKAETADRIRQYLLNNRCSKCDSHRFKCGLFDMMQDQYFLDYLLDTMDNMD